MRRLLLVPPMAIAVLLSTQALTACQVDSGLNKPCVLVKRDPADPTGNTRKVLTWGEIKAQANKDYISFGATECDDLTCVRDATFGSGDGGTELKDTDPAPGYCTRPCIENSTVGCPSSDSSLDKNYKTAMSCRALLLDANTLETLKAADPVRYQQTFGETTSPFFCARGGLLPDGGKL